MKCPKCGYLGFETTDRCRNCGYDFSLTPAAEPDLSLNRDDETAPRPADFDLADSSAGAGAPALDLDRLFGVEEPDAAPPPDASAREPVAPRRTPRRFPAIDPTAATDPSALPFDDGPPVGAPRPARQPLGVRRATPEVPRGRPKTTRPIRVEPPLDLGDARASSDLTARGEPASASALAPAPLGARLGALAIDVVLLLAIDAAVLVLTLRIVGLALTWDDVRVLPPAPLVGYLVVVLLGYLSAFTVAGGQTIGKMLMKVRVMGDDGRAVDLSGSILRAVGCALVPITLGLSYLPVLMSSDRRALHDRLAGTRVVSA